MPVASTSSYNENLRFSLLRFSCMCCICCIMPSLCHLATLLLLLLLLLLNLLAEAHEVVDLSSSKKRKTDEAAQQRIKAAAAPAAAAVAAGAEKGQTIQHIMQGTNIAVLRMARNMMAMAQEVFDSSDSSGEEMRTVKASLMTLNQRTAQPVITANGITLRQLRAGDVRRRQQERLEELGWDICCCGEEQHWHGSSHSRRSGRMTMKMKKMMMMILEMEMVAIILLMEMTTLGVSLPVSSSLGFPSSDATAVC